MNAFTIVTGLLLLVFEIIMWLNGEEDIAMTIIYALLGLAFLFLGLKIMNELEQSFTSFYWKYRCKLITATLLLCIPIMTFSILIFIRVAIPTLSDGLNDTKGHDK